MQYLFFLLIIPLMIIPPAAYGEAFENYDREFLGLSPEGFFNFKWTSSNDRIYDGENWINYQFENNPLWIKFEAAGTSFELDKLTCDFKLFEGGFIQRPPVIDGYKVDFFKDDIKTTDSCLINNVVQKDKSVLIELSKDGLKTRIILSMTNIEWYYDLDNREGKETTFRIEESCSNCTADLIKDGILYFGNYKLDTKDEQHRTLKSIGAGGKQIIIEYEKTLRDKETFEIDPTFSSNNPTLDGEIRDSDNSNTCDASPAAFDDFNATTSARVGTFGTGDSDDCSRAHFEYDISSIPDSATVTNSSFTFEVGSVSAAPRNCDFVALSVRPSTSQAAVIWSAIATDTVTLANSAVCTSSGINKNVDLGAAYDSYIESQLAADWVGVGIISVNEVLDAGYHLTFIDTEEAAGTPDPTLEIEYTEGAVWSAGPPINPAATTNIQNQINFTWTPDNATGTIGYAIFNASSETADPWDWKSIANTGNFTGDTGFYELTSLSYCEDMWLKTSAISLNNGTNTSAVYGKSRCGPPNAVETLTSPSQTFSTIIITWLEPALNGGILDSWQINYSDPANDNPVTIVINETLTTGTTFEIGSLPAITEFSFRVSPWTEGGNNGTGIILNASTLSPVGSFTVNATNPDIAPIRFERTEFNSSQTNVEVIFSNDFDPFNCDLSFSTAQSTTQFNNLDSVIYDSDFNSSTFQIVNSTNDVITFDCIDPATNTTGKYVVVLSDSIPLIEQVQGFQGGEFGTAGDFGALDLVTLLIVIVSMVGLNRVNQTAGVIISFMIMFGLAAFELIEIPTLLFGSIAVIIMLVVSSTRKP